MFLVHSSRFRECFLKVEELDLEYVRKSVRLPVEKISRREIRSELFDLSSSNIFRPERPEPPKSLRGDLMASMTALTAVSTPVESTGSLRESKVWRDFTIQDWQVEESPREV